ncbi:MAG: hypothetical protein MUQ65_06895 [Armatimonadetes bacterium]|nr:hypothetical protein [Armatimonadota bacterium]
MAAAAIAGIGASVVAFGQSATQSPSTQPGSSYLTVGLLDRIPLAVLFVLMVVVVLASIWLGLVVGGGRRRQSRHEGEGPVATVAAAILGLLAFMLAFTFGIASGRFDLRKQVVLDEAESIGTTYLRASMLPQPQGEKMRQCLREYVDLRVEAAQQPQRLPAMLARSQQLQDDMWAQATSLVAAGHTSPIDALFIDSLNRTIDLHTHRAAIALLYRIPDTVWIVLLGLSVISMIGVGYLFGLSGSSSWPVSFALALTFSTVIMVSVDLDRSTSGLLRVSQGAMVELQKTMQIAVPDTNGAVIAPTE